MNKRVKKGLTLMLLGASYLNSLYAQDYLPTCYGYSNKPNEPNQTYSVNPREDGGFGYSGSLEFGIAGLLSVYFLRRFLREKKQ